MIIFAVNFYVKYMESNKQAKANKGIVILLVIVIMALGAAMVIMFSKLNDQKKESAAIQDFLETQRVILENDLTELQGEFGALQTDNDSLMNLASEQQERITRLLAIQADNAYRIREYQRELETLRGVLRSYIVQVDSLNQSNIALRTERAELSRDLAAERTQTAILTEDRDRLTSTVQIAQVLTASSITITGLNNRDRETPRVRNVVKLQTCFIVRENQVARAGERMVYLVLVGPNNRVLTNSSNATFQTQDGAEIVYTDRRAIDYNNMDVEVCIFTDNNNRLTEGAYEVRLYCDGYMIGTQTFILR